MYNVSKSESIPIKSIPIITSCGGFNPSIQTYDSDAVVFTFLAELGDDGPSE